jgi:hypothetical protein
MSHEPEKKAALTRVPDGSKAMAPRGEECALKWVMTAWETLSRTITCPAYDEYLDCFGGGASGRESSVCA